MMRIVYGIVIVVLVGIGSAVGATHQVNCDMPGQTITKALTTAKPGDTIHAMGTCTETVTITIDRITLDGDGSAVIQGMGGNPLGNVSEGLVNIVGAQGVNIQGFFVQSSPVDGINGRQGASFVVRDTRVLHSGDDGIEATETSTVRFQGTCEMRGSGDAGILLTDGSSALFLAERVTLAENATAGLFLIGTSTGGFKSGTVETTHNNWGIVGRNGILMTGRRSCRGTR